MKSISWQNIKNQVEEFRNLPFDWDTYGSKSINEHVAKLIEKCIEVLETSEYFPIDLSLCHDKEAFLKFNSPIGKRFTLNIDMGDKILIYPHGFTEEEETKEIYPEEILEYLERLLADS